MTKVVRFVCEVKSVADMSGSSTFEALYILISPY
jgi:hypothetical protein